MEYIEQLTQRWTKVCEAHTKLKQGLLEVVEERDEVEVKHTELIEKLDLHLKSIEYIKVIMSAVTKQDVAPLENMLTKGLQSIFHVGYSVTISIDDRGKDKTAEFMVHEVNHGTGNVDVTPARETGFGIQTVLSLILQVFFLMYEDGQGILIWDEPLTQVSSEHIEPVFQLIKELVLEEGIDILGVTHDPRLLEFGDKIYRMVKGELKLERGSK